jgi:hypothetical protein
MCVTFAYAGSKGSDMRKSAFKDFTFVHLAFSSIISSVPKRLRSRSKASSLPRFFMRALRCDVLFPGAAVASMTTVSSDAGGFRTTAGMQDALSWRMSHPFVYIFSSLSGA